MATFMLVHGAWHGGWSWKGLTPLLLAAGHDVFTPTLTGLGERSHLLNQEIDLEAHMQDIIAVLHYEDLSDVTLVGHSYGGMVITGVSDRVPERLSQLIYLDAFVPEDGQSLFDLITPEAAASFREQAQTVGHGWQVPPRPLEQWGISRPEDIDWMTPRMGFHPLKSFAQAIQLKRPASHELPRAFIRCIEYPAHQYKIISDKVRDDPHWRYYELPTGHDAMVTMPQELADMLMGLV